MSGILGLDHVGIAVRDLDESIETYSALLGGDREVYRIDDGIEYDDEGNVIDEWEIAYLDAGNDVLLELIQPVTPGEGPMGEFLEANGEGIHHISFWVEREEFAEFFETLSSLGFDTVGDEPWRSDPDSERDNLFTYIHPKSAHGTLIELISPYRVEDGEMTPVDDHRDGGVVD